MAEAEESCVAHFRPNSEVMNPTFPSESKLRKGPFSVLHCPYLISHADLGNYFQLKSQSCLFGSEIHLSITVKDM